MNLSNSRLSLLPLSLLLLAPLAAQDTRNFAATRTTNYGLPMAGGSTVLTATASVTMPQFLFGTTDYRAAVSNRATVRLFGATAEGAAVFADYAASQTPTFQGGRLVFQRSSTASFRVRIAGMTVLSSASTTQGQSGNIADDVFLGDGVGTTVGLPFMNVRVLGNVTARATYDLAPAIDLGAFAVDLQGPARVRAVGRAIASATLLGATAGTSATLTYADTDADVALRVANGQATGTVDFTVREIRLRLSVFGSLSLPLLPPLFASVTLFDYSRPPESGTLVLAEQ